MSKNYLIQKKAVNKQQDKTMDIFIDNSNNVKQLISIALNSLEVVAVMNKEFPGLVNEFQNSLQFLSDLNFALRKLKTRE